MSLNEEVIRILIITGSFIAGYILFFYLLKKISAKTHYFFPELLQKYIYLPGLLLAFCIALNINVQFLHWHFNSERTYNIIVHILRISIIICSSFLLLRSITVLREILLRQYADDNPADFTVRRAKTKFQLIQRVLNMMIFILTASAILMTFPAVRNIGNTLLASAGIVGIIIGFAAQKSLGSLFAGIQIAIAQPIKLDDIVVVEGQFGRVGEITLTYVVIYTWDGKRKIVPISFFLEESFDNWTRVSPEVIGQVKIYTDYSIPVEELRKQCMSWIENSPLYDKRSSGVLVTNADEKGLEIRIHMSAKNSGDAWDLECLIREKVISYIQHNFPDALPKARINLDSGIK